MTTVYLSPEDKPGTHVLIVGVGAYTHLSGGTAPATKTLGMEQLSSPPVSAKAMVDWFVGPLINPASPGFRNAQSPLLSVEALIAAATPASVQGPEGTVALDGATLDQVRIAYGRWRARLIKHPGSTGIFYFCGHGLSAAKQYALCQDLLVYEGAPFEKAFDINATLTALGKEAVDCDIHFWFDACRAVSAELLLTVGGRPMGLTELPATDETVERSHSFLQATGEGKLAFSKKNKASRFTQALLTSLGGYAGESRPGNKWEVGSGELHKAVKAFLKEENKSADRKQSCAHDTWGEGLAIVQLSGPPKVKLSLDLSPKDMKAHGQLFYQRCDGAAQKSIHPCSLGGLQVDVEVGFYNLGAEAPAGQFSPLLFANEMVQPPLYDHTFEVGT